MLFEQKVIFLMFYAICFIAAVIDMRSVCNSEEFKNEPFKNFIVTVIFAVFSPIFYTAILIINVVIIFVNLISHKK